MSAPLRVLLPSDVFPPRCGGAGWSAHALALALIERGHDVTAIVPRRTTTDDRRPTTDKDSANRPASSIRRLQKEDVLGVPVVRVDYQAPNLPIAQNYFRHERFWPRLADAIAEIGDGRRDFAEGSAQSPPASPQSLVIHAQHVQTVPAAVMAGRRLGAPVVVTVRDHWPWDYFATGLHGDCIPYGRQTWASLAADLPARLGQLKGALALPAIPYMLAHLRRRQRALRQDEGRVVVLVLVVLAAAAVLLAVGPRFILGASGVEFSRAAAYAVPLLIWGAVQYPSWVGDQVQLGSNKPYIKSMLVFGEQVIRVVLAWILLERYQVTALVIAYFVGLLTKDFVAYFINNKYCFPQKFYFWQSIAAPLLAAGIHYLLMDRLSALIWQGEQITSIVIFFIGILPSLALYMFLYGLVGGWDDATLDEFRAATAMTGPLRGVVTWLMLKPTALGSQLSPLNNRFPISIRAAAMEEARGLTEERVKL